MLKYGVRRCNSSPFSHSDISSCTSSRLKATSDETRTHHSLHHQLHSRMILFRCNRNLTCLQNSIAWGRLWLMTRRNLKILQRFTSVHPYATVHPFHSVGGPASSIAKLPAWHTSSGFFSGSWDTVRSVFWCFDWRERTFFLAPRRLLVHGCKSDPNCSQQLIRV
jgi:hypothetical protein